MAKERFVVVPLDLLDSDGKLVILSDYNYWAEREAELQEWCDNHGASFKGMTIALDEKTLTAFCLRWT